MGRLIFVIFATFTVLIPQGWTQTGPKVINMGFDTIYVPEGFDNNDRVQVTIEGTFTNSCYRVGSYKVTRNKENIYITQTAILRGGMCLQILNPFHELIDLGILPTGNYNLIDASSRRTMSQVNITKATSSNQDESLYAPVSDAFTTNSTGGQMILKLIGVFPVDCLDFDHVDIRVIKNTIVVRPIMVKQAGGACLDGVFPYEKEVMFAAPSKGRYLLHVRSLNGQAINKLVDVY